MARSPFRSGWYSKIRTGFQAVFSAGIDPHPGFRCGRLIRLLQYLNHSFIRMDHAFVSDLLLHMVPKRFQPLLFGLDHPVGQSCPAQFHALAGPDLLLTGQRQPVHIFFVMTSATVDGDASCCFMSGGGACVLKIVALPVSFSQRSQA